MKECAGLNFDAGEYFAFFFAFIYIYKPVGRVI